VKILFLCGRELFIELTHFGYTLSHFYLLNMNTTKQNPLLTQDSDSGTAISENVILESSTVLSSDLQVIVVDIKNVFSLLKLVKYHNSKKSNSLFSDYNILFYKQKLVPAIIKFFYGKKNCSSDGIYFQLISNPVSFQWIRDRVGPISKGKLFTFLLKIGDLTVPREQYDEIVSNLFTSHAKEKEVLDTDISFQGLLDLGVNNDTKAWFENIISSLVGSLPDKTERQDISASLQSFADMLQPISGTFSAFSTAREFIVSMIEKFKTMFNNIFLLKFFCFFLMYKLGVDCIKKRDSMSLISYIAISVIVYNSLDSEEIGKKLIFLFVPLIIQGLTSSSDEIHYQSGIFEGVDGVFDSFFGINLFSNSEVRSLSSLARSSSTLVSFFRSSLDFIKEAVNRVTLQSLGYEFFPTESFVTKDLMDRYNLILDEKRDGTFANSISNLERVTCLRKDMSSFAMKCALSTSLKGLSPALEHKVRFLLNIEQMMGAFLVSPGNSRQEPVCVFLTGGAGTKKTVLSKQLQTEALAISLSKGEFVKAQECLASYVYNRTREEYWEGYTSTTEVVCIDDFAQVRGSVGAPDPNIMDLINCVNTSTYPLQMAFEGKGKTYFRAKWIFCTTNKIDRYFDEIREPAALIRRIHLDLEPIPNNEYCDETGKMLPIVDQDAQLQHFQYKVRSCHSSLPYSKGDIISHLDVVDSMKYLYQRQSEHYERNCVKRVPIAYQSGLNGCQPEEDDFKSCSSDDIFDFDYDHAVSQYHLIKDVDLDKYFRDTPTIEEMSTKEFEVNEALRIFQDNLSILLESYGCDPVGLKTYPLYNTRYIDGFVGKSPKVLKYYAHVLGMLQVVFQDRFLNHKEIDCVYRNIDELSRGRCQFNVLIRKDVGGSFSKIIKFLREPSMDAVRERLQPLGNGIFPKILGTIIGAGVLYVSWSSVTATYALISSYLSPFESFQSTDFRLQKDKSSKTKPISSKGGARPLKPTLFQAGFESLNLQEKIERSNIYGLTVDGKYMGTVIFVNNQDLIMPLHFHLDIADYVASHSNMDSIVIKISNVKKEWQFSLDEYDSFKAIEYNIGDTHLLFMRAPAMASPKRDLISYFITDKDYDNMSARIDVRIALLKGTPDDPKILVQTKANVGERIIRNLEIEVKRCLTYEVATQKGDCGSPIVINDPRLGRRQIMGFHFAGNGRNIAFANVITQNVLLECKKDLDDDVSFQSGSSFVKLVKEERGAHNPYTYSKIVMYEPLKNSCFPQPTKTRAKCFPNEKGDPLDLVFSKYFCREWNPDENSLVRAQEDLSVFLNAQSWKMSDEILTVGEAMYGLKGWGNLNSIPSGTSPGFPYTKTNPHIKKSLFPEEDADPVEVKKFQLSVLKIVDDAQNGIRREWYYTQNLKDELLPIAKVLEGKTRPFYGTPLQLYTASRIVFGRFVDFYMTDCLNKDNASTVNPYTDWIHLVQKLTRFSSSFDETWGDSADFSAFDASNNPHILRIGLQIIQDWYSYHGCDEYHEARKTLFQEVLNARFVSKDGYYEMTSSLPSGSFLTLLMNCITHQLLIRYAYFTCVKSDKSLYYSSFHNNVSSIVLGDDGIYTCHPSVSELFNPLACAEVLKRVGFAMTSDTKEDVGGWRKLSTLTFLKRSFLKEKDSYYGSLSLETIMNTPCYTKKGVQLYDKIFEDNVVWFFRELSLHQRAIYSRYSKIMIEALKEIGKIDLFPDVLLGQAYWRQRVANTDPFFSC